MMRVFLFTSRVILAAVFLAAGLAKLTNRAAFAIDLPEFVPTVAANLVAITLPWIEITAGVLLLTKAHRRGILLAAYLAGAFVLVLGMALVQGKTGPCGCFGVFGSATLPDALGRAALLLALAAVCYGLEAGRRFSGNPRTSASKAAS